MRVLKYFIMSALSLLMLFAVGCSKDGTDDGGGQNPQVNGKVNLTLRFSVAESDISFDGNIGKKAIVNGVSYDVTEGAEGEPVVAVYAASDNTYTVLYPAETYSRAKKTFILSPSQFSAGGGLSPVSSPMRGSAKVSGRSGVVTLDPLCGVLKLPLSGTARIASIRVESKDGDALSGTFDYDEANAKLKSGDNTGNRPWVVLNCAGSGRGVALSAAGTEFAVALPAGTYSSGLQIRVTDTSHRSMSFDFGANTIVAGQVKSLSPCQYAPDADLLFAEHFDRCVWGADPSTEYGGYGPGSGSTSVALGSSLGTESAYVAKSAGVAGTEIFEKSDYTNAPAASSTLAVKPDYLRNRGLYDWRLLFYASEWYGCLGGGDTATHKNRGIIVTPFMTAVEAPCRAELSFRIYLEEGMASDVGCRADAGLLTGCSIDGREVDVDVTTSSDIAQSGSGVASRTATAVLLRPSQLAAGEWHTVRMSFDGVSSGTTFRFVAATIRDVNNCFWIDDVEVRRTGVYPYDGDFEWVEPTTARGRAGEDISRMKLRPSAVMSMSEQTTYTMTGHYNMPWICPSMPKDKTLWTSTIEEARRMIAENGCKVWCVHMPYGERTSDPRDYDLCAPDQQRVTAVNYYTGVIRALAPLKPANVLVHCNQTLAFNDGSSVESMVQSLHELQLGADKIGAHLVVENMSYGVGADAKVLADAVDAANAKGSHLYEIRIAMDTGHANLYLTREKPSETVVDWLRTAGTRIGQLHIHGNRGYQTGIHDDHLVPGYAGALSYHDMIGKKGLWGEYYKVLLGECLYRGPFTYEAGGSRSFGQVNGEDRYDCVGSPWHLQYNYDTYIYPAFREANK